MGYGAVDGEGNMKVGDLVEMKSPKSQYSWRKGAGVGHGLVIEARHRTEWTTRGCTVMWSTHPHSNVNKREIQDMPEDWLVVINESG